VNKDSKKNIKIKLNDTEGSASKVLWTILDSYRGKADRFFYKRYSKNILIKSFFERLNKKSADKLLSNPDELFELLYGGLDNYVPDFVIEFINIINYNDEPKSILDPWANRESYIFRGSWETKKTTKGYNINKTEFDSVKKYFNKNNSKLVLGEPISQLEKEKGKYDSIITFLPFHLKTKNVSDYFRESKVTDNSDLNGSILEFGVKNLNKGGSIILLVSNVLIVDKKFNETLVENKVYINGVFSLPAKSLYPKTLINTSLIYISKTDTKKIFVSKISENQKINRVIFSNFLKNTESQNPTLGRYFKKFQSVEKTILLEKVLSLGKKTGYNVQFLSDFVLEINKDIDNRNFRNSSNAIYVSKHQYSRIHQNIEEMISLEEKKWNKRTSFPSKEKIIHKISQQFYQIKLKDIESVFLIKYLNSTIGKLTIKTLNLNEQRNPENFIKLPLYVPEHKTQLEILKINSEIELISKGIKNIKNNLWDDFRSFKSIQKKLSKFQNKDDFKNWITNIPFPIASILWHYIADNSNRNKVDILFEFFEALSQFLSIIILSALHKNYDFLKQEVLNNFLKKDQTIYSINNADFGFWNNCFANLSKQVRTHLNNQEHKNYINELFDKPEREFFDFILNKKIFNILDEIRVLRNSKGHHRVKTDFEINDVLKKQEILLNKLKLIINDNFDDFKLIHPEAGTFENGMYSYNVKSLTGNTNPFEEIKLKSSIPLEKNKLYFSNLNGNTPIEMLPFIKYREASPLNSRGLYFYNKIESQNAIYVSYHIKKGSSQLDEKVSEKLQDVFDLLNNKHNN
tara:strand:- start:2437 stop:4839 length:2403 start_codon:yes stop_codon:yes gene_type:complete